MEDLYQSIVPSLPRNVRAVGSRLPVLPDVRESAKAAMGLPFTHEGEGCLGVLGLYILLRPRVHALTRLLDIFQVCSTINTQSQVQDLSRW